MGERIELAAEPPSVATARRFCTSTLRRWGADPDVVSTCELLVSELATNAVLHARTSFTVALRSVPRLRVEVADGDSTPPCAKDHEVDSGSGRGLQLVDALSAAHGADPAAPGKRVWFEIDWSPSRI